MCSSTFQRSAATTKNRLRAVVPFVYGCVPIACRCLLACILCVTLFAGSVPRSYAIAILPDADEVFDEDDGIADCIDGCIADSDSDCDCDVVEEILYFLGAVTNPSDYLAADDMSNFAGWFDGSIDPETNCCRVDYDIVRTIHRYATAVVEIIKPVDEQEAYTRDLCTGPNDIFRSPWPEDMPNPEYWDRICYVEPEYTGFLNCYKVGCESPE